MDNQHLLANCQRIVVGAIISLVSYPLSFGPTVWLIRTQWVPDSLMDVYAPLGWLIAIMPAPASDALLWYAFLWD
jgi:hypothetical protein